MQLRSVYVLKEMQYTLHLMVMYMFTSTTRKFESLRDLPLNLSELSPYLHMLLVLKPTFIFIAII